MTIIRPGVSADPRAADCLIIGTFSHSETHEEFVLFRRLTAPYACLALPKALFPEAARYPPKHFALDDVMSGIYGHFRKREYQVYGRFVHAETGERLVAYRGLYAPYARLVRPESMFFDTVDRPKDNYRGPRFWLIHPD